MEIWYYIYIYMSTTLPLLSIPSWALAVYPFLSPLADGLSPIRLVQPQWAALARHLRLRECDKREST